MFSKPLDCFRYCRVHRLEIRRISLRPAGEMIRRCWPGTVAYRLLECLPGFRRWGILCRVEMVLVTVLDAAAHSKR